MASKSKSISLGTTKTRAGIAQVSFLSGNITFDGEFNLGEGRVFYQIGDETPIAVNIGLAEAKTLSSAFNATFKNFVEKKVKDHAVANIS